MAILFFEVVSVCDVRVDLEAVSGGVCDEFISDETTGMECADGVAGGIGGTPGTLTAISPFSNLVFLVLSLRRREADCFSYKNVSI